MLSMCRCNLHHANIEALCSGILTCSSPQHLLTPLSNAEELKRIPSRTMSTTIHFSLISEPHLLDVIDDEWMEDTLADDGYCSTLV